MPERLRWKIAHLLDRRILGVSMVKAVLAHAVPSQRVQSDGA